VIPGEQFKQTLRVEAEDCLAIDHRNRRERVSARNELGACLGIDIEISNGKSNVALGKKLFHHSAGTSAFVTVDDDAHEALPFAYLWELYQISR